MKRISLFIKMVLLLVMIMLPTLAMFTVANHTSIRVVEDSLYKAEQDNLYFLIRQMDDNIRQLQVSAVLLSRNPVTRQHQRNFYESDILDMHLLDNKRNIQDMLMMQSASAQWINRITIYTPRAT